MVKKQRIKTSQQFRLNRVKLDVLLVFWCSTSPQISFFGFEKNFISYNYLITDNSSDNR